MAGAVLFFTGIDTCSGKWLAFPDHNASATLTISGFDPIVTKFYLPLLLIKEVISQQGKSSDGLMIMAFIGLTMKQLSCLELWNGLLKPYL